MQGVIVRTDLAKVDNVEDLAILQRSLGDAKKAAMANPYARRIQQTREIFGIYKNYFELNDLAIEAINTNDPQKLKRFKETFTRYRAVLNSDTGRLIPRRKEMLVDSDTLGGWLAGTRLKSSCIPETGSYLWGWFHPRKDGLIRALDAISLDNVVVGLRRISLPANTNGSIEWEFKSPKGASFDKADVSLVNTALQNENDKVTFSVSTDDGRTYKEVISAHNPKVPIILTDLVKDKASFRLKVSASNSTDNQVTFIEDMRIHFKTK